MWISNSDRRIRFLNRRAEVFFERPAADCLGLPCYGLVCARDEAGHPFCAPACPAFRRAQRDAEIEPVTLQVRNRRQRVRWIQLLSIPVTSPDGEGPWMVDCAVDTSRAHRIQDYLARVAARTTPAMRSDRRPMHPHLTPREREVLAHLAGDEDLPTIAARLHVSHVTVRNHVQHILAKLGVHSVPEAVARHLLDERR